MVLGARARLARWLGRCRPGRAARAQTPDPTGSIRGRVEVRRERIAEARPSVAALGMPAPRDRPDRRRSVVYLETAPQGAFEVPPPRAHAVLDQRNEAFAPYVLAVSVGTTVDFPNSDRTYHNVFSLSKARRFDLGRYPRGESRSVRFDEPGVVRVFCEIHSHMNAFILVFAHRYFATTEADGRYRIDDVRRGATRWQCGTTGQRERRARAGARRASWSRTWWSEMAALASLRSRVFAATAVVAVLPIAAALGFAATRFARARDLGRVFKRRRGWQTSTTAPNWRRWRSEPC